MSNLLPLTAKKESDRLMRRRFVLVFGMMASLSALIACLAILPAYISVRVAHAGVEGAGEFVESPDTKAAQQTSVRTVAVMNALKPIAGATSSPSSILEDALAAKPAGISVTMASYRGGTFTLSGTASRREAVSEYRQLLEDTKHFTEVAIPVAALVGTQAGRFTITLKGAF